MADSFRRSLVGTIWHLHDGLFPSIDVRLVGSDKNSFVAHDWLDCTHFRVLQHFPVLTTNLKEHSLLFLFRHLSGHRHPRLSCRVGQRPREGHLWTKLQRLRPRRLRGPLGFCPRSHCILWLLDSGYGNWNFFIFFSSINSCILSSGCLAFTLAHRTLKPSMIHQQMQHEPHYMNPASIYRGEWK
jgi:hypothetical protein